ncbi:MAG: T9SS type A sorting domain-containing protein [Calditrichia bacterium]
MLKLFVFSLFLISCLSSLKADIINVPGDQPTIQAGINQSINGDTVLVDTGRYYETINFNGKNIVLASHFILDRDTSKILQTILDKNKSGRIITINSNEDSSAKLIGFTIQNGASGQGGGIFCEHSNPILSDLIIQNNFAGFYGGGIFATNANLKIMNTVIKNNDVGYNDWVAYGGGIYLGHSNSIMENVRIINNGAAGGLGGSDGGGIFCSYSILKLKNVLVCKNFAAGGPVEGAGVTGHDSEINLVNSTISNNHWNGLGTINSNIIMINSIVWNNQGKELSLYLESSDEVKLVNNDIMDTANSVYTDRPANIFWIGNNIESDPLFKDPNTDNYDLLPASPCIDAGVQDTFFVYNNNNDTIYIQQMDYFGLAPDMGAFEYNPATSINKEPHSLEYFILYQNYPNPFNPVTTIAFSVPAASKVTLKIFDILGREVAVLMDNELVSAGHAVRRWNAGSLSSGIYFYQLRAKPQAAGGAASFTKTKKLILMK